VCLARYVVSLKDIRGSIFYIFVIKIYKRAFFSCAPFGQLGTGRKPFGSTLGKKCPALVRNIVIPHNCVGLPFTDVKRLVIRNVCPASPKCANTSAFCDLPDYA
jgi:hypothetical protein